MWARSGLQDLFKAVYLSQPVVVAQFEQAREKAFSFPGSHELLPLPHILLQEILSSQLCLPLRLRNNFLTCRRWNQYNCERLKVTCIKPLCSFAGLASCREAFFPGFVRGFGVLLQPQLRLGVYFIAVGPHCGQRLNSSILHMKGNKRDTSESRRVKNKYLFALCPKLFDFFICMLCFCHKKYFALKSKNVNERSW